MHAPLLFAISRSRSGSPLAAAARRPVEARVVLAAYWRGRRRPRSGPARSPGGARARGVPAPARRARPSAALRPGARRQGAARAGSGRGVRRRWRSRRVAWSIKEVEPVHDRPPGERRLSAGQYAASTSRAYRRPSRVQAPGTYWRARNARRFKTTSGTRRLRSMREGRPRLLTRDETLPRRRPGAVGPPALFRERTRDDHLPPRRPVAYASGDALRCTPTAVWLCARAGLHGGDAHLELRPPAKPQALASAQRRLPTAPSSGVTCLGVGRRARACSGPGATPRWRTCSRPTRRPQFRPLYRAARRVVGNASTPHSAVALGRGSVRRRLFILRRQPPQAHGVRRSSTSSPHAQGLLPAPLKAMALMLRYSSASRRVAAYFTTAR
jgi:hypothetical protein